MVVSTIIFVLFKAQDQQREADELKECTFKPELVAHQRWGKKRERTRRTYKKKLVKLAQQQKAHMQTLHE